MYTYGLPENARFDRIGAIDIETNGLDGAKSDLVSIGVGYYREGQSPPEIDVITRANTNNNEIAIVKQAFEWINNREPEGIVTYNGSEFDFPFINKRLSALGVNEAPTLTGFHIDLYQPRKRAADQANEKWPSLEECLQANGIPIYETVWNGETVDNTRFGNELAPAYLKAIEKGEKGIVEHLDAVVREYTASDIEANIALYEADTGRHFEPSHSVH